MNRAIHNSARKYFIIVNNSAVYLSVRLSLLTSLVTFELTIFLLVLAPLFKLNYFMFNLFLFLQKKGGGGLKPLLPAPPSARSLMNE